MWMEQEPLMSAAQHAPQQHSALPDPVRAANGILYPRWPLLAALLLNAGCFIGYLLRRFAPCPGGLLSLNGRICQIDTIPGVAQFLGLWLIFLLLWLCCFISGYAALEGTIPTHAVVRRYLRAATTFDPIRWLLAFCAGCIFIATLTLLWRSQWLPVPLALNTIAMFVTCWIFIRRNRQQRRRLSPDAQYQRNLANTASPLYIFRSLPLIRGIWRPSPPQMPLPPQP
ncbi:MAG TPA: hypothetical protein VGF67_19340 [Ktedonobacteraceae bacterium]|jgi:hypothetical protein